MSTQPSVPPDSQFTADELLTIVETFEIAVQTKGFIDTTSSGGVPLTTETELLAGMRRILGKANELHRVLLEGDKTADVWHVWPLDSAGEEIGSFSEFWSSSAADALVQASGMAVASCPDVVGWKVIRVPNPCSHPHAPHETESPS
jgi:hypothetical protein